MLYIYILIDLFAYIHNYATMKEQSENFEAIRRYNSNTINTKLAIKDVEKIW